MPLKAANDTNSIIAVEQMGADVFCDLDERAPGSLVTTLANGGKVIPVNGGNLAYRGPDGSCLLISLDMAS